MLDAFGLGVLAQSSLLLAGLLACWVTVPTRLVGILAGFGAGAMISAIAFDLVPEATEHIAEWQTVLWMLIGVAIFLVGDWLVDKRRERGGGRRDGHRRRFGRRRRPRVQDPRHSGRRWPHDQSRLRRRRFHLEYPAGNCSLG
jgi:hypothetical protein